MSVLKIVQSVNTLAVTGTAATTNGITLQSGILRVSAASTLLVVTFKLEFLQLQQQVVFM
jgi:hypothetical protein